MQYPTGGDLLVAVLRELGIDTVFGIVSVHNLPLVEAVDRELRFVPVRHEATAVNAADAYGRARGSLGCALTSTGTGAGNAAGSLVEALSAGTSVLHVTGQVEAGFLGSGRGFIHETKDQLGMLRAVSTYAETVTSTDSAGRILREAARAALKDPGGPASVEWPVDLQYAAQMDAAPQATGAADPVPAGDEDSMPASTRRAAVPDAPSGATERVPTAPAPAEQGASPGTAGPVVHPTPALLHPTPAAAELIAAQALLATSERPVIWAGGGATRARTELTELLHATGAGLLTSNSGRGAVPEDHPQVIGNFATTPAARALLADADVLLTVGTHFRSNETADYGLALPEAHIQVDIDAAALGRVYPARHALHGHAPDVLAALLPHARRADESWTRRVAAVRQDVRATLHDNIGPQAAICDAIRAALPREAVVARDVTIPSSSWGNRLLEMYDPRDNVFPRGGGIGQGLGMGIGAALARPDAPTVVLAGDGGLAVHLGELLTLAQERPRLTLIVFNDGGYGVLRNMQDRYSERRSGVDLATPDFELLAQACGLAYARIAAEEHATPVISHAVASEGPTLVEVDLARLGPMKNPFTPPVKIPGQ
ncbi:thiamine pyrophosphate-binding protein [Streptomyces durmitorensis]|uniref:Thiamine pyrophosphate-binding protein n=1 Tax=Streptomyces durmitorensis TaxID=319947 RepID=A0ABY4Q7Y8_9ACTN|nr:thiamine pyrophosphate-binding protein [Streptomyces durmitorensis]UQT61811.1 thiamine pyrophosphate-binding protein [Streptomyces durmitorensis]